MQWSQKKRKQTSPRVPSAVESYAFVAAQVCLAGLVIYWLVYPPTPGYAVTVLALGAAAMSLNGEIGRWKKGGWLLILVLITQIELRAISKDRQKQETEFLQTISTITGGDSYALMSLRPLSAGLTYPFLVQSGVNPLHDVKIKIVTLFVDQQGIFRTLELRPRDIAVGERNQLLEYPIQTTGQRIDYVIYYDALNGHWTQQDSLRLVDGKWFEATKVSRPDDPGGRTRGATTLFEQIDPGFPVVNGKPDWNPF